jgi:hypothetical protein
MRSSDELRLPSHLQKHRTGGIHTRVIRCRIAVAHSTADNGGMMVSQRPMCVKVHLNGGSTTRTSFGSAASGGTGGSRVSSLLGRDDAEGCVN